ncbi:MAG: lipopolysaccharide transport periplasmic protein LptA [Alphaproteobacteria bacterium]|nr:lipopolysaccharide transport periplasmic protein LptA [Alphaproteobacteria bacterium]
MTRVLALVAVLAALAAAMPARAQEQVEITADRFVIEENANLATFSGNVVIVQGTLTVHADTVIVHYGSGGAADIENLDAIGSLVIDTPTQHVTGNEGSYDPETRVMIVTGDVVSESESGRVTGKRMRVDFEANTTEFETEQGGRVTGVFNP